MNQKRIERLIPIAFKILDEENEITKKIKPEDNKDKIKSVYKGYMSSIGPSIVQAGIIKSIASFSKETKGGEGDRSVICKLIKKLLLNDGHYTQAEKDKDLLTIILNRLNNSTTTALRLREEDRILEAITAYKLVFDTCAKYDEKEEKKEVKHA